MTSSSHFLYRHMHHPLPVLTQHRLCIIVPITSSQHTKRDSSSRDSENAGVFEKAQGSNGDLGIRAGTTSEEGEEIRSVEIRLGRYRCR